MRICLVASGLSERNRFLQPWRYLLGTARGLTERGYEVVLLTDRHSAAGEGRLAGLPLLACRGTRWPAHDPIQLARTLGAKAMLWHVGRTSLLAPSLLPRMPGEAPPIIGIWTCPLYRASELLALGPGMLLRAPHLSAAHVLGLLVRDRAICDVLLAGQPCGLVVECEHTRARLVERGVPGEQVHVVRPAIDPLWFRTQLVPDARRAARRAMGYDDTELVIGTFGPAEPLRGLPDLLSAVAAARVERPELRLLAFCRHRGGQAPEEGAIPPRGAGLSEPGWAQLVLGWQDPAELTRKLAACDLIVLPFRLVSSDVPLSVLEAMALGKPVIVTKVGCLQELVPRGTGVTVLPGAPGALAEAILLLARGPGLRAHLGAAARARAVRWQAERGEARWEQLLREATERPSSTWRAQTEPARAPRQLY